MTYTREILGRRHSVDFCDFAEKLHAGNLKPQLLLKSEFRRFTLWKLRQSPHFDCTVTQFPQNREWLGDSLSLTLKTQALYCNTSCFYPQSCKEASSTVLGEEHRSPETAEDHFLDRVSAGTRGLTWTVIKGLRQWLKADAPAQGLNLGINSSRRRLKPYPLQSS